MMRGLPWLSGLGALLFLLAAARIGSLDRGLPPHGDLRLDGDVPATLYLPGDRPGLATFVDPVPVGERPPAVVLMHGFASDRLGMSSLARRLAMAGYAVLTFDAGGHGENRNPFPRSRFRADSYHAEYAAVVDFLRSTPLVDGERIAVMGHSMGASAALDFATRDTGIDATVLIAGGRTGHGPHRPPNALFLYAAGDPGGLKARANALAARLAGVDAIALGRTYGDVALGNAVRAIEMPGVDHATVVGTEATAREIAAWLDAAFGRSRGSLPPLPDPRLFWAGVAGLSLLLVLPGLGLAVGRLVPEEATSPGLGAAKGLSVLALGLVVTLPLLAAAIPASLLSVEVGDAVVSHFAATGLLLWAVFALRGERLFPAFRDPGRILAGAAVGLAGVYLLLLPLGTVVHRLTLTPERALVFVLATALLLPFSLAYQGLLRRGPAGTAALACALGRVLVVGVLLVGVLTGLLPFVLVLMLPALVLVFVLFELLAGFVYAASRNTAAIAAVDAAWLAWIVAAIMPIRL